MLIETKEHREFAQKNGVVIDRPEQLFDLVRLSATGGLLGWDEKGRVRARFNPKKFGSAFVIYNERRTWRRGGLVRGQKKALPLTEFANSTLDLAWSLTLRWCPPGTRGWAGAPLELLALEMFHES